MEGKYDREGGKRERVEKTAVWREGCFLFTHFFVFFALSLAKANPFLSQMLLVLCQDLNSLVTRTEK